AAVRKGRAAFMSQFRSLAARDALKELPDPTAALTFHQCKLQSVERDEHQSALTLHRDLLLLRREDPAFNMQRPGGVDGAVLGSQAFVLRFFPDALSHSSDTGPGGDRLVIVNLGAELHLDVAPVPLLAPPAGG